jgi:hypothetical protein
LGPRCPYLGENILNTEKLTKPIGDFEFVLDGYPTTEVAQKLFDALDFQRACQAYLDFVPAMSMYSLLEGQEKCWGCKECSNLHQNPWSTPCSTGSTITA